jgi:hypothetical protein
MAFLWLTTDGEEGISVQETASEIRNKFEEVGAPQFVMVTRIHEGEDDEPPWRKVYIDSSSVYAIEEGVGDLREADDDD